MRFALSTLALALFASASALAADDPSIQGALRQNIKAAMFEHMAQTRIGDDYVIYDAVGGELKRLQPIDLHEGIVRKGDFYVSCADMEDQAGTLYDLDFLVAEVDGRLQVLQALVHKVGDAERAYHVENVVE